MLRMIIAAALCLLVLPLTSCATTRTSYLRGRGLLDLCKGAAIRRTLYTATITGTDAYAASGRPLPTAVILGREAAATALAVLNVNCPAPAQLRHRNTH